ncbi:hypothetical protein, partial [Moorena sp. SIO3I6]|uniref:hypothetical protein n=1 Tax=Moorena sp. SIO3I6 TaxID=2607831 RepID=UPI0025E01DC7
MLVGMLQSIFRDSLAYYHRFGHDRHFPGCFEYLPNLDTAGEINICLDIGQPVGPRAAKREHRVAANGTPCHQLTKRTI